jgi:hypothetical protein
MTRLVLFIIAFFLCAAAPPPPPEFLSPYVTNGAFDPGDFRWMRGKFSGASASERQSWTALASWLDRCTTAAQADMRQELVAMGVREPKIAQQPYRDTICLTVSSYNVPVTHWTSFEAFIADLERARPVADSFLLATRLAVQHGGPRGPTLADRLIARPLGEQILRSGLDWGAGQASAAPPLPRGQRSIVMALITAELALTDRANTEYLKQMVTSQGWPDRREVGDFAAHMAWLTAQHADSDPAFQLRILRLMEPMLPAGGVHPNNYAFLYDRVMLKIAGRQRYGTQAVCRSGAYVAQPLEEADAVDTLRATVGLEPLATYLQTLSANSAGCS